MRPPFILHTRWQSAILLVFLSNVILAQKPPAAGTNIVPNPGFERFTNLPLSWTYKGADFGRVVKYWFSATTSSPDIYGPGVKVPKDWAYKGFGKQKARTGNCMAGITLYGCTNGKPHCREYIEIQLAEPLVVGQWYYVEFWVAPMRQSLHINNLGAYFSVSEILRTTDEVLIRKAQVQSRTLVKAAEGGWAKVSGNFEATYEAEYMLIGNFNDDENTRFEPYRDDSYNYAYYYVDDVLVKKIPPIRPVPIKPDDLSRIPLTVGKPVQLKNIYFEFDRDELMPRSYVELNKLFDILTKHPNWVIEIVGHTDNMGDDNYNLQLSRRRAQAVINFLVDNGIVPTRLYYRGEGERRPIATNDTDEGRQLNRRVEFIILKK